VPGKKPSKKTRTKRSRRGAAQLPSKDEILQFIEDSPSFVGKREIARAFQVKGPDRIAFKDLLREMANEGLIRGRRKRVSKPGKLPPVTVIEIVSRDDEGELLAVPSRWDDEDGKPPSILIAPQSGRTGQAVGIGDRALASLTPLEAVDPSGALFEASVIRRLPREAVRLLGIYRSLSSGGGVIDPIDRKQLREWSVREGDAAGANDGDLVRFEIERGRGYAASRARITDIVGNPESEGAISLIALQALGLPDEFPTEVLEDAESLAPPEPGLFEDLRDVTFVTIDPPDARDHDDAVWAEPDGDKNNPGGWIVRVAIADVSWFVRPGSALDKEALKRGNSIYFPERVVPMLPERISNDLCSLREKEERSCLCVRMVFDAEGRKRGHKFTRAMMQSTARLNYGQVQLAIDGVPDEKTGPILDGVIKPLWDAYGVLAKARDLRAPLDLDLPERKIILDDQGKVEAVTVPPRLEANRLIEEFMIQANVSAAETLEAERLPLIYRAHDAPSKEKIVALRDFLATLDMSVPKAGRLRPEHFNRILDQARQRELGEQVSEVVLRSQSQAEYSSSNFGHFGLNLCRYAHFTSPIRRYADLIVHRALVAALDLGPGGLMAKEIDRLDDIAESISESERRGIDAERQTVDRLIAAYLADRIGASFSARVSGVVRSGLFVRLEETGADGFVPASSIHGDYFRQHERQQALIGDRTGASFRLGDVVEVRLIEAVPSAGALRFEMLSSGAYRAEKQKPDNKRRTARRKGRNRASRRRQR
jgi:ribonuclease R